MKVNGEDIILLRNGKKYPAKDLRENDIVNDKENNGSKIIKIERC